MYCEKPSANRNAAFSIVLKFRVPLHLRQNSLLKVQTIQKTKYLLYLKISIFNQIISF